MIISLSSYLNTIPVGEIVKQLRHLDRIFSASETPKFIEAQLVKAEKQEVSQHHVQGEIASQDTAGHVVVVVFQKYTQRILVSNAAVQHLNQTTEGSHQPREFG